MTSRLGFFRDAIGERGGPQNSRGLVTLDTAANDFSLSRDTARRNFPTLKVAHGAYMGGGQCVYISSYFFNKLNAVLHFGPLSRKLEVSIRNYRRATR